MRLRKIRSQLVVTLHTQAGHKFHGEWGDPNGFPRPRSEIQSLPHRALTTAKHAMVKEGDVVTYHGTQFLLCGQHQLAHVKMYLAVQISHHAKWSRVTESVDPILGVERGGTETVLSSSLPVTLDPKNHMEEVGFDRPIYRVLTGSPLLEGDLIDQFKVMKVVKLFGIHMAEVT
jgi:hypothetical protein